MKKHVYQQPQLTVVSFKVERGFASSITEGLEQTFELNALFELEMEGSGNSGFEQRVFETCDENGSASGWGYGW